MQNSVFVSYSVFFFSSYNLIPKLPEYLEIQPSCGELYANDEVNITCYFKAFEDSPSLIPVEYEITVKQKLEISIGRSYVHEFHVRAEVGYAELCVS